MRSSLTLGLQTASLIALLTSGIAHSQEEASKEHEDTMSAMGRLAHSLSEKSSAPQLEEVKRLIAGDIQSETSIASDSTGMHIVVGFNDFRGLSSLPFSASGFAYSDDGGVTWVDGGQLPTPGNDVVGGLPYPWIFGDPDVKYLGGCTFVYSSLMRKKFSATTTVLTLSLHRSNDCGHTWSGPYEIPAATNPNGLVTPAGAPRDSADKELLGVDPDTGRLMVSWTNFTPGASQVSVAFSDDAATANPPTWSPRSVIANLGIAAVPRFAGNGSENVYVSWERGINVFQTRVDFAISPNNGATWEASKPLTPSFVRTDQVLGNDRVHSFPSLAVDTSGGQHQGNIYVVHSNNDQKDGADISLLRSVDGGASFLPPLQLNSRPGSDRTQWFPYVTVDDTTGRVFVIYYDQGVAASGDLSEATYLYSDDGGANWSQPLALSARPFHAGYGNDVAQPNLGDYIQAVARGNELFATWAGNPPVVDYTDGLPDPFMSLPDVYVRRNLVFKKTSASKSQAAISLGSITFVDGDANGHVNVGERIDLWAALQSPVLNPISAAVASGVTAKLFTSTSGVHVVQENGTYPNLSPGSTAVNRQPYILETSGGFVPGTRIELALDVHTSRGQVLLPFTISSGTPDATTIFSEEFDSVGPGVLPTGWLTIHTGGTTVVPWTTSNSFCGTTSNAGFHPNDNTSTRTEALASPVIAVPAGSEYVIVEFDTCYDTEEEPFFNVHAYDGFLLSFIDETPGRPPRIDVLAEAFAEEFTTGDIHHYPKHLPRSSNPNYFQAMSVWAGPSDGFKHVRLKLPGMAGSSFRLAFNYTQDSSATCALLRPGSDCGVMVDNIVVKSVVSQ